MTLAELLVELRENILHDRSDRIAGEADYLWSDATLVRYINEAHRRFARKGLVIRDATTAEVCEVTLVEDQTEYVLHPSILAVISAKLDGAAADLARAGHSAFDTYRSPDNHYFDVSALSNLTPGAPVAYSTDEYLGPDDYDSVSAPVLRVYPAPSADYAGELVRLRVVRLPLENFSTDRTNMRPEIPEDHHLEMLDWAAYLALRIVDVDGGMATRADEFRKSFEEHVRAARQMSLRRLFAPLTWGFGRNGYSWER
jgi:hypothetical protein